MISPDDTHQLSTPVRDCDHRQGNPTAWVKLVVYGDYQCPDSKIAEATVQALQKILGDELEYIFRHFPQESLHHEAGHAAEAAEAAGSQGKFWEMHNCLFEHQEQLADNNLVEYAIALQLNINQFLQEVTSDRHLPRIEADINSGRTSGVTQTPTFFINGQKQIEEKNIEGLLSVIRELHTQ